MRTYITKVQCLECRREMPFCAGLNNCSACGGVWLDAQYDYDTVAQMWRDGISGRDFSLWRYLELLPVLNPEQINSMGEGYTPLTQATKLQSRLGHPSILIKDERQSPTSSFKDRQAALATTAMLQADIKECVLASTGNAAAAYAAYCARADIKLWIFLTSMVPAAKMREAALYGAEIVKVAGTYDQAKKVAADFAAHRGIHFDKGAKAIPGKESMKTVAFEIAEALARQSVASGQWQAPDWYVQAVSGGIGPIGVQKGFEELYRMGLIDRIPKIGVVQVAGCSPMVRAFSADKATADPVVPETRITVLSTGAPGLGYELLYQANQSYGGHMLSVTDDEAFEAMRSLARTEGYSVEPATAVAFAGLEKMITQSIIEPHETVVVNCSGHTFPVEKHIMDEENLLDVQLSQTGDSFPSAPLDGLGAALKRLDEQVTTIVVIDDNPMDSRLIRRLLQAKKPYRVFEANTALEGLKLIRERLPDLVVSDLSMPEMDGFALLQELKSDPLTAGIPVIVVSAKDLTKDDERRLAGQTSSIWMKGSFSTQDLVEHVVSTVSGASQKQAAEPNPQTVTQKLKACEQTNTPSADPLVIKKVVLIEDNAVDARLISRILQMKLPVLVTQIADSENAIEIIKQEMPQLITLDLNMPDRNGFQILEDLKKDKALNSIPVIVITSKILSEEEKKRLILNNVRSIWQKGQINREKLVAQVEAELQN